MGLVRSEVERVISEEEFARHWPRTAGRRLTKTRYRLSVGALVWEIDTFDEPNLVLAEVELPSPDAAAPLPEWLAPRVLREVTDDPAYRNYEIAVRMGKGITE
jgi:CYTH domain-containing protein